MLKKCILAVMLVLLVSGIVFADPWGPARFDLMNNQYLIDQGLVQDNINPVMVQQIVWQGISGSTITNTYSGDVYRFYFDPFQLARFYIYQPNGDQIRVEFYRDPDPSTLGIQIVISGPNGGPIVLQIPDTWTTQDIYNAVRQAYMQVSNGVKDAGVWMALKVLLVLLNKYYP